MASPPGSNSAGIIATTTSSNGGGSGGGGGTNNRILAKHPAARGFQIRKVPKITVEQERDLRDQLHMEIEQKTKACSNFVYDCSLPRVDSFDYCMKHILQDPLAPYKQCSFMFPRSNKRCQQPAPKRDVYTNMCFEHSRQTQLQCTRSTFGTYGHVETNETLLRDLGHRVDAERRLAAAQTTNNKYVDPFSASARVLNYASDDSDAEAANIGGGGGGGSGAAATTASGATAAGVVPSASLAAAASALPAVGVAAGLDADDADVDIMQMDDAADGTAAAVGAAAGAAGLNAWAGQDMDESDNESVDSQNEDFLKHAGIYTTEEATVITKSKMLRLQTLYSEQIQRLHHLLRQKRRSCLLNVRVDRDSVHSGASAAAAASAGSLTSAADKLSMDALANAAALAASGPVADLSAAAVAASAALDAARASLAVVETRKHKRQKALNQYLKKNGVEAVLQYKASERRRALQLANCGPASAAAGTLLGTAGGASVGLAAAGPINRCMYSEGGVKCGERGIPLAKYCRKHILKDRAQVLFKACGIEKSGVVCQEPVPITFENATCVLHFELPPQRVYTQKKYESDEGSGADDDDELLPANHTNDASQSAATSSAMATSASSISRTNVADQSTPVTSNPARTTASTGTAAAVADIAQTTTTTNVVNADETTTSTMTDLDDTAAAAAAALDNNDLFASTAATATTPTCVEQSAEAMSPLRVSPIDLESDVDMSSGTAAAAAAVTVSVNG